jgi:hypothetical protein
MRGINGEVVKIQHPAKHSHPEYTKMWSGMVEELAVIKVKDLEWLLTNCGFAEGFETPKGCEKFLTQLSQKAPHFYKGAYPLFQKHLSCYKDMTVPLPLVFTKDGYRAQEEDQDQD